jgi:hypothetical protein
MTPKKPGPKPRIRQVQGQDYYCGTCAGHGRIWCQECVGGCHLCKGIGKVQCPTCLGGAVPVAPPQWDPDTDA